MVSVDTLLSFHNFGHTDLQMDRFITARSGGTLYGCFVQSLRELWGRARGLQEGVCERRLLAIDIEELAHEEAGALGSFDSYDGRRVTEKLRQKRQRMVELEMRAESERREFLRFYGQAAALFVALGFDREPPTEETIARLDAERWEHHVRGMIAVDLLTGGRVSKGTAELLQCLAPAMKRRIMRECLGFGQPPEESPRAHDAVIRWFMEYCPPAPEPLELTAEQSERLIECCESSISPKLLPGTSPMDVQRSIPMSLPVAS